MPPTIGIDLGTTNSLVAIMKESGPVLIPNSLGQVLTPSVVGVDEQGQILVGQLAKELQVTRPESCASIFKRQMGSNWKANLGKRSLSAIELSSLVLRSLKDDAEAHLGEPVEEAVITVPAYFNEEQRRATITAGQMAGLKVDRILNEPTAAAIAYGLHSRDEERTIVVVDLGGGTFDVSIVEMFEGTLEIRASAGEVFLGGEDFTSSCAAQILKQLGLTYEVVELKEPLRLSRLRRECELAKRRLTKEPTAEIRIPNTDGSISDPAQTVTVHREQFDIWTRPILDRIIMPIRRALGDADLKRSDVNQVVLVGGATRMPCLIDRVEELFGQRPECSLNPDEVVALGAAVHAGIIDRHESLKELVVTDVAPFTLGIEISRMVGDEQRGGYFLPIINRNTTIPVSRVQSVTTLDANQAAIRVAVYQGESRLVKDNHLIGQFDVVGIRRGPAGQEVEVRFTYDLNGVLEVEATVVDTQKKTTQVFTRHAKGMSARQVSSAVEKMQALKLHPRDDAENRLLIRRSERLYAELPQRERRMLDELLHGFESVLDLRDAEAIQTFREELNNFLNTYDSGTEDEDHGDGQSHW